MNLRAVYEEKERDPRDFQLFERIWDVLTYAPSCRHTDEEERISLTWDAFDYLHADGRWATESDDGRTEIFLEGEHLRVAEDDSRDFKFERTYNIQ